MMSPIISLFLPPHWLLLTSLFLFFVSAWFGAITWKKLILPALVLLIGTIATPLQTYTVSSHALLLAVGLTSSTWLLRRCHTELLSTDILQRSYLGALLWAFVFGKLVFARALEDVTTLLPFSSLAAYVAALLFLRWRAVEAAVPFASLLAPLVPSFLCLEIFNSLGLFLAGRLAGPPTESFFAVTFPATLQLPNTTLENPLSLWQHSADFAVQFPNWVPWLAAYDDPSQGSPLCLPVHPLALYRAASCLALCVFLHKKPNLWFFSACFYLLTNVVLFLFLCTGESPEFWLYEPQWTCLFALLLLLLFHRRLQGPVEKT